MMSVAWNWFSARFDRKTPEKDREGGPRIGSFMTCSSQANCDPTIWATAPALASTAQASPIFDRD
jgi:hypothetical protein